MSKFPYSAMFEKQDALERLDVRVRWGRFDIRVLRFHLTTFAPGRVVDFHKHDEFEFHFIPRGKGKVILETKEFALREGMFYLTGPGVMHHQAADPDESMDELCLHVDIAERYAPGELPEGADRLEAAEADDCIEKLRTLPLAPALDLHEAMPHFLAAYEACSEGAPGLYTTIKQHVVQILLKAARAYDASGSRQELPSRDMKAYRYRLAMQYIRANYAGTVTLDNVAEKLNISARQLQRIFKEIRGDASFSGILEEVRLEAVCKKLTETELSVERIAVSEGFSNGNYLHAVFRRRFGMTPSAYRKAHHI
ncbi:AraC family transcriptional regulator [Paenibacillus sp.]|uniref:AraC family transcriptional regulator n=1 Tax=Paenibacillus sp. TaxID=58172 RepID=UPI002D69FD4F|nr:helix-turn-helix domain-containing protein [Paenibacillus sp.]HZG58811.1 helix-turn-helix domain-containing protein [Paenibacillus sp.]